MASETTLKTEIRDSEIDRLEIKREGSDQVPTKLSENGKSPAQSPARDLSPDEILEHADSQEEHTVDGLAEDPDVDLDRELLDNNEYVSNPTPVELI